jgi:hypothetical protein
MNEFNKTLNSTDELEVGIYEKKRWIIPFGRILVDDIYIQSIDNEEQTAMIRVGENGEFYKVSKRAACDYVNEQCFKCCKDLS